ncbi:MAG: matrixin family metalloprotease [Nanoarchaeota archaeon]|nr:matrixin family metalloprotease [Nanoarchaeota archaeon]
MNKKINFVFGIVFLLLISCVSAGMLIPADDESNAPSTTPIVDNPWGFVRVDIIHYEKGKNIVNTESVVDICYGLTGVKWNTLPVSYYINPKNPQGLSQGFITSAISTSAETWDSATTPELFNDTYKVDSSVRYGKQDFKNTLAFGSTGRGIIAVTRYWYYPSTMQLVEFDILFNTRYKWGNAALNPSLMDLQNIATHELGHGVGLDDIYTSSCNQVTMYGYSTNGETIKRTLETPDVTGLQTIYGP